MGLFDRLFRKPPVIADTPMGPFSRIYSKKNNHLWTHTGGSFDLTVRGTAEAPDPDQVAFCAKIPAKVETLDQALSRWFLDLFAEAELEPDFTAWQQRYTLVEATIQRIENGIPSWELTFEEKGSFHHFRLLLKDNQIMEFSMDT